MIEAHQFQQAVATSAVASAADSLVAHHFGDRSKQVVADALDHLVTADSIGELKGVQGND